jgi:hypothetical protein
MAQPTNLQDILRLGGEVFKSELAKQFEKYNLNASGRTLRSINPVVSEKTLTVFGADHIQVVQDGRQPTRNTGNGELLRAIKEWVKFRGIPDAAAYPITKKIHQEGTALFRGTDTRFTKPTDVLSLPTQRTITYIQKEATQYYALEVRTTIVNVLNKTFV